MDLSAIRSCEFGQTQGPTFICIYDYPYLLGHAKNKKTMGLSNISITKKLRNQVGLDGSDKQE